VNHDEARFRGPSCKSRIYLDGRSFLGWSLRYLSSPEEPRSLGSRLKRRMLLVVLRFLLLSWKYPEKLGAVRSRSLRWKSPMLGVVDRQEREARGSTSGSEVD
jgi:hypothetical protein